MNKQDIASFFDRCAPWWDADMIRNEDIIRTILDNGNIREGVHVLDVACGTGVLFPDYLQRNVGSVTGIDISPEMAKLAAAKFPQVQVICGDVEETKFDRQFDCIMVYNAFPHFPDPAHLIEVLAGLVKTGGTLSIAHGMSRSALIKHHERASTVSIDLLHEQDLAALLEPWFEVNVIISNDHMYQVTGTRRDGMIHTHHGHRHVHAHGHSHDHSHGHADITPMAELLMLMKYMVDHNDAHAQELADLAMRLQEMGDTRSYHKVMEAVAEFDVANAKLSAVWSYLKEEQD